MKINKLLERGSISPIGYRMNEFDENFDEYDFIKIITYANSTFGIKSDGTVWSTGVNNFGQLGLGHNNEVQYFKKVDVDNVKDIICGGNHTVIIKNDGTVWSCGDNQFGQLGLNDNTDRNIFTKVDVTDVKYITTGLDHTFIIKNDGSVWSCGKGEGARLGLSGNSNINKFTQVSINNVKDVICGGNHTFILKNDGTVWSTGRNTEGQLGLGNVNTVSRFTQVNIDNVRNIYCGVNYTFIIKNDGTVWSTGVNDFGQLGLGNTTAKYTTFTKTSISNTNKIYCGKNHTFILKNDGTVWSTGRNTEGQLGLGDNINKQVFTEISIALPVLDISIGDFCTFLMFENSPVQFTGSNIYYQIGNHPLQGLDFKSFETYQQKEITGYSGVYTINGKTFITLDSGEYIELKNEYKISCGNEHTFIIKNNGEVYSCGRNSQGQLGLGDTSNKSTFTKVNITDVKDVICGHYYTFIIKNNGEVYSCGRNNYGQLGLGNTADKNTFTKVNITDVKDVICGHYHAFIIKNNGGVYGCGRNYYGQLGLGNTTDSNTFTKVMILKLFNKLHSVYKNENFVFINQDVIMKTTDTLDYSKLLGQIYSKHNVNEGVVKLPYDSIKEFYMSKTHSLILLYSGEVYGCGYNTYGQLLFPRTTVHVPEFTKLPISGINSLACGEHFSMFVDYNGHLFGAGDNFSFELGLGNNNEQLELVQVPNVSNVKFVACGDKFNIIILNDNTLWVQGYNRNGNLGLGIDKVNVIEKTFTKVDVDVESVEIMSDHILIRKTDKSLWICGKDRPQFNFSNHDINVFNKVNLPTKFTNQITAIDIGYNDNVLLITKVDTVKPTIEISSKSVTTISIKVNDHGDEINKIEMHINNELISTNTNIVNSTVVFEIPANKLNIGVNNIFFKAYTVLGDTTFAGVKIIKQESHISFETGHKLLINGKKYAVINTTNEDGTFKVTLDKPLEDNINPGDVIARMLNVVVPYIQTNGTGEFKSMDYIGLQKVEGGYRESYIFNEKNINSASVKFDVVEGDKWTALKRPTVVFKLDVNQI